jgi:hypothetical protein
MKAEKKDDGFVITLENDMEEYVVKHDIELRSEGKTIFDVASDPEGLMDLFTADGKHSPEEVKQKMLDEDVRVSKMFTEMMDGKPITAEDFALLIDEIDGAGNIRCGGWASWGRTTKRELQWLSGRDDTPKEAKQRKLQFSKLHHMMIDAMKLAEELGVSFDKKNLNWVATSKGEGKVIEVEDRPDLLARADL